MRHTLKFAKLRCFRNSHYRYPKPSCTQWLYPTSHIVPCLSQASKTTLKPIKSLKKHALEVIYNIAPSPLKRKTMFGQSVTSYKVVKVWKCLPTELKTWTDSKMKAKTKRFWKTKHANVIQILLSVFSSYMAQNKNKMHWGALYWNVGWTGVKGGLRNRGAETRWTDWGRLGGDLWGLRWGLSTAIECFIVYIYFIVFLYCVCFCKFNVLFLCSLWCYVSVSHGLQMECSL